MNQNKEIWIKGYLGKVINKYNFKFLNNYLKKNNYFF